MTHSSIRPTEYFLIASLLQLIEETHKARFSSEDVVSIEYPILHDIFYDDKDICDFLKCFIQEQQNGGQSPSLASSIQNTLEQENLSVMYLVLLLLVSSFSSSSNTKNLQEEEALHLATSFSAPESEITSFKVPRSLAKAFMDLFIRIMFTLDKYE
jgi:hypothetical protein